jgi:hypothetical protein
VVEIRRIVVVFNKRVRFNKEDCNRIRNKWICIYKQESVLIEL